MTNIVKKANTALAKPVSNDEFSSGLGSRTYLPRLSIRGKRFRVSYGNEETLLPDAEIEVVLVSARPGVSKVYYAKAYGTSNEDNKPICASRDGIRPDPGVPAPQSDLCATCRWNAFGSAASGKGKACSDYKLLVVTPAKALDMPLALHVPATSFKKLDAYIKQLNASKLVATQVITTLSFADVEYPQLEFAASGVLDDERWQTVLALRNSEEVQNIVSAELLSQESQEIEREEKPEQESPSQSSTDIRAIVERWAKNKA